MLSPVSLWLLASFIAVIHAVAPPTLFDVNIGYGNINHGRVSFRSKYVTHSGQVLSYKPSEPCVVLTATASVPELAVTKAATIITLMVKNMPDDVFLGLSKSHGAGLFTSSEGPTVYPENARLADRPECYNRCDGSCSNTCTFDGRKWQHIAGLTNSRAVCLDDVVLCNSHDPYGHRENIFSHEFAHLIMGYMPKPLQAKIFAAYANAKTYRLWRQAYAMATVWEYFAEATEAFFLDVTRTDVTGGMNMCGTSRVCTSEMAARSYLKKHDPLIFAVLSYTYTGNKPSIPGGLKVCQ